jgi:hypothetical protein
MLRALVALLLLANVAFLGWSRGWFAPAWQPPRHGEREPERLAAQLRPEFVVVLPPKAASEAVSAARAAAAVCLQTGPLSEAELVAAKAALAPQQLPEGSVASVPVAVPPPWVVYAGRVADPAVRRARQAELDKLGLPYEVLAAPPELSPGLVLSRHASRTDADAALAALAAASRPLKGARVLALPAGPALFTLKAARADAEQQARLQALPAAALAGGFKPCATAP